MDKLRSMEVFVAAVDTGSFTAAAHRFGISAVMVGKHVRELEQLLGAALLTRTTRRQSLTEIGRQYAEQCRAILASIASAEAVAETMRASPRGAEAYPTRATARRAARPSSGSGCCDRARAPSRRCDRPTAAPRG